jgi:predicted AAA+ superfamily ATPase
MQKAHFDALIEVIIHEVKKTRDEGQKEYAHTKSNVFANFERTADLLDESREKVLMTFLLKHIDGIAAHVKGHESQREDITGRLKDAIVYLMLLWGMIEEERSKDESSKDE